MKKFPWSLIVCCFIMGIFINLVVPDQEAAFGYCIFSGAAMGIVYTLFDLGDDDDPEEGA